MQGQALSGSLCLDLVLRGPCPNLRAHLGAQGWELQVSTSAGCWASALHRAGGTVRSRWPWASTQRTVRSRRPPPQEALHGPKSPAAQLRRRRGVEPLARTPSWLGGGVGGRHICPADSLPWSGLGPLSLQVPGHYAASPALQVSPSCT